MTKQDYATPRDFFDAVERRFGLIEADLAASAANAKCVDFIDVCEDSLSVDWASRWPEGNLWLNPPFKRMAPWAAKASSASVDRFGLILMLSPASIGAEWFARHVHRKAMVLGLSPRIAFEGCKNGASSDLMLSVFGLGLNGFDVWRWDGSAVAA